MRKFLVGFFIVLFLTGISVVNSLVVLPMEEQEPHRVSNRSPKKHLQKVGEAPGLSAVRTMVLRFIS